jgi:hypothetical protein
MRLSSYAVGNYEAVSVLFAHYVLFSALTTSLGNGV